MGTVIKTWLRHNILDYCIDELFGAAIKNFTTPSQTLTRVSDITFRSIGSHCIVEGSAGSYICTIVTNTMYSLKYSTDFPRSLVVSSGLASSKYAFVPVKNINIDTDTMPTMIYLRPDEYVDLLGY